MSVDWVRLMEAVFFASPAYILGMLIRDELFGVVPSDEAEARRKPGNGKRNPLDEIHEEPKGGRELE